MKFSKSLVSFLAISAMAFTAVPVQATDVALFFNSAYVDTAGTFNAEADNMLASIESFGHTVSTFTGITAADFTAAFFGNQAFVMPEQEVAELNPDLDDAARAAIRDYVEEGGRMIIASDGENDTSFTPSLLNAVFGFSVTNNTTVSDPTDRVPSGTIFDTAPASLPLNNATEGLDAVSLPSDALAVYSDGTVAVVVIMPIGMGEVIFLGYDWHESNPPDPTGEDGGWQAALTATLAEADLAIAKTASALDVDVGDQVTYTLIVTNNGPSDAINVTVTDNLPAGVTLISATPSQGTCAGSLPIDCDLDGLANGASAAIEIVVTTDIPGDLTNEAEVSGAMIDPDLSNNMADASVTVVQPLPPNPGSLTGAGCGLTAGALPGFNILGGLSLGLTALMAWRRLRAQR